MPWLAPMLSVKTSAMTEMPAEKRSPVRMDGMASGTIDLADQAPALQPEAAGRLDHAAVHVAHAVGGVEVHGEQRGQTDEEHLGRLADAEPDDEQEDQGGVGDACAASAAAHRGAPRPGGQAHDDPEGQADPGAERQTHRRRGGRRRRCRRAGPDGGAGRVKASHVAAGVESVVARDDAGGGEDPPGDEDRRRG